MAFDPLGGRGFGNCLPASGSPFAVGTTTVTCSAADASGNLGHAAFRVTVVEPPPPPADTDADDDGVGDEVDPYDHSNLDPFVSVGACPTRVANRLLPSGASFNDLIGTALAGARHHGAGVSAVVHLAHTVEACRAHQQARVRHDCGVRGAGS